MCVVCKTTMKLRKPLILEKRGSGQIRRKALGRVRGERENGKVIQIYLS